ncbi:hypothetical protein TNCV_3580371 [Trichonephila clavipes]|nr:hypothetical protein TNCV_3580371 [Trichonephila clavipes]
MNGGHGQRNEVTLYLLTKPASACNIAMCSSPWSSHTFSACPQPYSNKAKPHVTRNVQEFLTHQIKLPPSPACSSNLLPNENVECKHAERRARDAPLASTPDYL